MALVIKIRKGSSVQWNLSTKILQIGELGIDTTLNKIKAGNGSSVWSALPWLTVNATELASILSSANDYTDTAISSLGNTADLTYVPLSDVGNPDGVASLDINGFVPESELSLEITKNTATQTLTNKTISISSGLTSVSGYDDITAFFGQSNVVVFQDGIDKGGKIDISSVGVITQSSPGSGYTPGLGVIGGGTRVVIATSGNIFTGRIIDFNASLTDGDFATESYVNTAVSNLVDSAPGALNTLNEIAAAINDDASYAATITTALGNKLDSNYVTIGNTLLEGISGQSYGLIGTSAYLDVKNTNGYNKEIELDIAAVKAQLNTDGYLITASQSGNSGKYLTTNGSSASWATISLPSAATSSALGTVYGITSSTNAFLGQGSGVLNTSTQNVGLGYQALSSNVSGFGIVAVGYLALRYATGNANTSVGNISGGALTTGVNNAFFGYHTAIATTEGDENTALGFQALTANIIGDQNTAIGSGSLSGSKGDGNIGIGRSAGYNLASGSNNIIIGTNNEFSSTSVSNEITIGNSSNNRFRIPGLSVNWTTSAYGRATYASTSAPSGGSDGDVWLVYTA